MYNLSSSPITTLCVGGYVQPEELEAEHLDPSCVCRQRLEQFNHHKHVRLSEPMKPRLYSRSRISRGLSDLRQGECPSLPYAVWTRCTRHPPPACSHGIGSARYCVRGEGEGQVSCFVCVHKLGLLSGLAACLCRQGAGSAPNSWLVACMCQACLERVDVASFRPLCTCVLQTDYPAERASYLEDTCPPFASSRPHLQ